MLALIGLAALVPLVLLFVWLAGRAGSSGGVTAGYDRVVRTATGELDRATAVPTPEGSVVAHTGRTPSATATRGLHGVVSAPTAAPTWRSTPAATPEPTTSATATPSPTAKRPLPPIQVVPTGRVLFSSNRRSRGNSDDRDIYVVRTDGTGLENLTAEVGYDGEPSWAPTGESIAFASDRTGVRQVWVMDVDGSHPHQITEGKTPAYNPDWSPDGTQIAFVRGLDKRANIWVMSPTGEDERQLTRNTYEEAAPAWSPDGRRIVFMAKPGKYWQIYSMKGDGSDLRRITHTRMHHRYPRYMPDGRRIVFNTLTDASEPTVGQIGIMNLDGTNVRLITQPGEGRNGRPFPSPDGRFIAFNSDRLDGNFEIYVMRPNGLVVRRLTRMIGDDFEPAWSP
ncbi:MAG: DPP IV N-terminal domain-containing protein [Chloroflexota bacterium]|nr:DPP IV N-terminal domain-containing protein [Chloroflexota bacterium]